MLGVLSNPMGSVPMWYDAWSYVRYKGKDGKSDTTHKL
jgi:glycine cleavage system protein P-like pyridoxal-binding family